MEYLSEQPRPLQPGSPDWPDFGKMPGGLVPAVVQDARTGVALMLGYMNEAALQQTLSSGLVTFFSRSRQRLWTKGESSGHVLRLRDIRLDCDCDALLVKAEPKGPVCHTGAETCWSESNRLAGFLGELEQIIRQRSQADPSGSYTARMLSEGVAKVAQKVGEEAVETVIEALGNDRGQFLNETADLLYHLLLLLHAKQTSLAEVEAVLEARHQKERSGRS